MREVTPMDDTIKSIGTELMRHMAGNGAQQNTQPSFPQMGFSIQPHGAVIVLTRSSVDQQQIVLPDTNGFMNELATKWLLSQPADVARTFIDAYAKKLDDERAVH